MKSYLSLTKKFLTKQYKRSILMILAAALSVSIMAATGILIDSLKEAKLNFIKMTQGSQEIEFRFVTNDNILSLKKNNIVKEIGLKSAYVLPGKINQIKESLKIVSYDKIGAKLQNIVVEKGHFPLKNNEIAVEESFANKNNLIDKLGKNLNLDYNNNYEASYSDTTPASNTRKSLVLVGIIKDREISKTWGTQVYVTLEGGKKLSENGNMLLSALVKLTDDSNIDETIDKLEKDVGFPSYTMIEKNYGLIAFIKTAKTMDIFYRVVLVIILLAAIASIYNIFSISVIERTRIFGLLRAIGADHNQVGKIILGEAVIISMIAIPIGLIIGTIFPAVIIPIISKIAGAELTLKIDSTMYPILAIISFIAVLISSLSPMRLSKKITPIEAVSEDRKALKNEYRRSGFLPDFLNSLFGIQGKMSGINLTRNKKRCLATLFSISISIMIFTVVSYFITILDPVNSVKKSTGGDYVLETSSDNIKYGFTNKQLADIKALKGIKSVQGLIHFQCSEVKLRESLVTDEFKNYLAKENNDYIRGYLKKGICPIVIEMYAINDAELKKLSKDLSKGKINIENMRNSPTTLLMQSLNGKPVTKLNLNGYLPTTIVYAEDNGFNQLDVDFKVGGFLKNMSIKGNYSPEEMVLIVHEKYIKQLLPQSLYKEIDINLSKDANEEAVKSTLQTMALSVNSGKVVCLKDEIKNTKDLMKGIYVILYGFVIIIGIIGILNLINTITINILTRRKEFGMLRAIGMSLSQMKFMILLESLFYGILGTFIGSVLGIIISYGIYNSLHQRVLSVFWIIPVKLILLAAVITIIIIILSSILPYKRITSEGISDSIKNID